MYGINNFEIKKQLLLRKLRYSDNIKAQILRRTQHYWSNITHIHINTHTLNLSPILSRCSDNGTSVKNFKRRYISHLEHDDECETIRMSLSFINVYILQVLVP
jgi:hypothetical protein